MTARAAPGSSGVVSDVFTRSPQQSGRSGGHRPPLSHRSRQGSTGSHNRLMGGSGERFGQLSPAASAAAKVLVKTMAVRLAFVVSLVVSATVRRGDGTGSALGP